MLSNSSNRPIPVYISFTDGPVVFSTKHLEGEFKVKFINSDSGETVFTGKLKKDAWVRPLFKFFVPWVVEVYNDNEELIFKERLDLRNKLVKLELNTTALGDSLAWAPFAKEFADRHQCEVHCFCEHWQLFKPSSNVSFSPFWSSSGIDYYAKYTVGFYTNRRDMTPVNSNLLSIQGVAAAILGLENREIRPQLFIPKHKEKAIDSFKYVCIGTQSTAQCKYWNNKEGWRSVVTYLSSLNYKVVCIDKHKKFGIKKNMNTIPENVIDQTGDISLQERILCLKYSDFFIGLPSGLSWLAWAVGKPVVLISGFSKPETEFPSAFRVFNDAVCNGCWNDPDIVFNRGDWMWCPRQRNFECSSQITFEMVKKKIDAVINNII